MKHCLLVLLVLVPALARGTAPETVMSVSSGELAHDETVRLEVAVDNRQPFTGFQFDLVFDGPFAYSEGSAILTDRAQDHSLSAAMISENRLRVVAYSLNVSAFADQSGAVASFTFSVALPGGGLASEEEVTPGTYTVSLEHASVVSMQEENMLEEVSNGSLTFLGARLKVSPDSVDYEQVPLDQAPERSLQVQNTGNTPLQFSEVQEHGDGFTIAGSSPSTLQPGQSASLVVRFEPCEPGAHTGLIQFRTNDPVEPVVEVALRAYAFSVNELYLQEKTMRSSTQERFEVRIKNMDPFSAFQFSVRLPESVTYLAHSVELAGRATDHEISADTAQGRLNVVAWSAGNTPFSGNDGVVASVILKARGTMGSYALPLEHVVIGSPDGQNILSASYNGRIQIQAPRLVVSSASLDFGTSVITEEASRTLELRNTGNDTLVVEALVFDHEAFFSKRSLPLVLAPWRNTEVNVYLDHREKGEVSATLLIRSNDISNDPAEVVLSGERIHQNRLSLRRTHGFPDEVSEMTLELENMDTVSALQCDLVLPDGFTLLEDQVALSHRASGHSLAVNKANAQTWRLILYSSQLAEMSEEQGPVLYLPVQVSSEPGNYTVQVKNAVLSGADAQKLNVHADASIFKVQSRHTSGERSFEPGWNLFSLPVHMQDRRTGHVLPEAAGQVLGFDQEYVTSEMLDVGKGYWVEAESAFSRSFEGGRLLRDTIRVEAGWNLIGSISEPASVSYVEVSSSELQQSLLYTYHQGYRLADVFEPGYGYWLKASEQGYLVLFADSQHKQASPMETVLATGGAAMENGHEAVLLDTLNSITFRDSRDQSMTLYFTPYYVPSASLGMFVLPPVPPPMAFDLRFADNKLVASLNDGARYADKALQWSHAVQSLQVSAHVVNVDLGFELVVGIEAGDEQTYRLSNTDEFTLDATQLTELRLKANPEWATDATPEPMATGFALQQNYPNPFNPSTSIGFSLAESGHVRLSVYTILGQEVARIVDEVRPAGRHEVYFDAGGLASGVYIYRLSTQQETQTRRMLLAR